MFKAGTNQSSKIKLSSKTEIDNFSVRCDYTTPPPGKNMLR